MEPTNLNQPVYTYTPSVKAGKVAGPTIQTYIAGETLAPGGQFNAAVAAADQAARASSPVQGKSVTDYIAANRGVFNIQAANLSAGETVADYQNAAEGASSSSSTASAAAAIQSLGDSSTSKSFQDYLSQAEGKATSSSAASQADLAEGKTIQNYFSAAEGGSTTP